MALTLNTEMTEDKAEDYSESYEINVGNEELEKLLESAEGRFEIDGITITRLMPECIAKSKVPMFLVGEWGQFYKPHYDATSGTNGLYYEGRKLVAPDMNLFHKISRRIPPANQRHMMLPGCPAQNWCLEVEWESEANQRNKGFDKVNRLFSYTGANNTQIEEVWLLIYPQDDNDFLQVPEPAVPLPIIERGIDLPVPNSKYFAVFVRELNPAFEIHHVYDAERPFLVGYYVIEPNMSFRVPVCSLLAGAPDITTNELLDAMGYEVQIQTI
jgi:hypothetical protein